MFTKLGMLCQHGVRYATKAVMHAGNMSYKLGLEGADAIA